MAETADTLLQRGTLWMSTAVPDVPAVQDIAWSGILCNRILAVVVILFMLANLPDFIALVPKLVFSATRINGFRTMEHNIKLSRTRNFAALCCVPAFCLLADRFSLYTPQYLSRVTEQWSSLALVGVFAAYLLLRQASSAAVHPRRMDHDSISAVHNCPRSLFVLLTFTALATAGLLTAFRVPDGISGSVILAEAGIFYLYSLLKTGQILASHCGSLATILYLCALEVLPTAALIVSALVL